LGRWDVNKSADVFLEYNMKFKIVVEDSEYDKYVEKYSKDYVLKLPGDNYGCSAFVRNYLKSYSLKNGYKRHWQIDDDIKCFYENHGSGKVNKINPENCFSNIENYVDNYINIAIASISGSAFGRLSKEPLKINQCMYSTMLIDSRLPCTFVPLTRLDLDFTLQCLELGLCSMRFYNYLFSWSNYGEVKGGYTKTDVNGVRLLRIKKTAQRWKDLSIKYNKKGIATLSLNKVFRKYDQKPIPINSGGTVYGK
jgi:hypothetical protein